jgi:hypothetical protein
MTWRTLLIAVPVVVATACWPMVPAAAQSIYSCRDHAGRIQTSDRPMTDCVGVMRELGPSGIVKREIAPPLTPDQLRQKDADDRAKRIVDEALREKRRRDMALLAAYQSEDQIEAARKRSLSDADASIRTSRTRLDELQKEKKALMQESDLYKNKPMPPLFKRKLDDNQALIDDEEASMKMRQADVERVNLRYDDDRNRFRELVGTGKATGK